MTKSKKNTARKGKRKGKRMTITATAGNVAGQAGEKDKDKVVEKRRALGRGLSALFAGPRVVPASLQPSQPAQAAVGPPAIVPQVGAIADDGTRTEVSALKVLPDGDIYAVVDEAAEAAELRSAGQPGAAVPTRTMGTSAVASSPFESSAPGPQAVNGEDSIARDESGEPITIYAQAESRVPGNLVINLAIAEIDKNPFQTRYVQDDEALEELAESIKANGVVQPIVVRPTEGDDGRYTLILGERRLHASKKAGKTHIPALVRKVSLQQAAEMTIVENLQREDLSPLEQAEAFRVLSSEFNLTQQQIAERVGLSRESVSNYMRLLKLPREVMQLLAEKRITFAKAKELLKLGDNDRIAEAALYAVKKGMNIEQIEMLVLRMDGLLDPIPGMPGAQKKEGGGARWVDPNVRAAQTDLERLLGVRVRIRDRKGKGKIVIEYSTVDDYERVVEMLRGKK